MAMTKRELRDVGEAVSASVGGKEVSPFVGTWMDRPGASITIRLTSKADGKRIVVHKWDDEDACEVTVNEGDFWRGDPAKRKVYGKVAGVEFSADAITATARGILG